jgi:hypothetical protein
MSSKLEWTATEDRELERDSPFVEYEEGSQHEAGETRSIVPFKFFAEIGDRENGENNEGDHFLYGLQLRGREFIRTDAIRRDLKTVFEKGDAPTGGDYFPQSFTAILEMSIPCKGHENVRDRE